MLRLLRAPIPFLPLLFFPFFYLSFSREFLISRGMDDKGRARDGWFAREDREGWVWRGWNWMDYGIEFR